MTAATDETNGRGDGTSGAKRKRRDAPSAADDAPEAAAGNHFGAGGSPNEGGERKKKEKKKKKRQRAASNSSAADVPAVADADAAVVSESPGNNKKSKKKDKRKRKNERAKAKETHGASDGHVDPPGDSAVELSDGRAKKKTKKEKKKKQKKSEGGDGVSLRSKEADDKVVSSSAVEHYTPELRARRREKDRQHGTGDENGEDGGEGVTLLLFYQYVEPPWDDGQFREARTFVESEGRKRGLTGRMRVSPEGLNCTLTGSPSSVRGWCAALREYDGGRSRADVDTGEKKTEFSDTEFKLTDDLPPRQRFGKLNVFEVVEIVNYGLAGRRAPSISRHGGTHLEPREYDALLRSEDTVVIDVRNHYEANIGRFSPPEGGAEYVDPAMRKSTEFPMWLDKEETREKMRGKKVLMYCTGGVRCERASALLKQKIDAEEDVKSLGIKGVYQLQGGIDKYFKEFPGGGLWKGKNYVFDKRFAHAPPAVEARERTAKVAGKKGQDDSEAPTKPADGEGGGEEVAMGKCEACLKPWVSFLASDDIAAHSDSFSISPLALTRTRDPGKDMYRGKRRCPACGVPSLVCRDCFEADRAGTKKLGKEVRCDLCVAEDVKTKRDFRAREERETRDYERKLRERLGDEAYEPPTRRKHAITRKPRPNPDGITRLFLKNLCARSTDEASLLDLLGPATVTHVQWLTDRVTGKFYGSAFVEVRTPEDAGSALALDGARVMGRKILVKYQRADNKDVWPVPGTEVKVQAHAGAATLCN
ncbi:hypothetical protein ACHAWF_012149 [Thalassiosira exigua]